MHAEPHRREYDEKQITHSVAAYSGKNKRITFFTVPVKLDSKERLAMVLLYV